MGRHLLRRKNLNARSTPVRRTPRKRISAQRRLFPLSCILLLFCLNACASPQTASPGGNAAGDAAGDGNAVLSAGSTPESARTGEPAEVPDPTPALPSAEPAAGAQAPEAGGNAETIPPLTIPVPDNERLRRFREQYISENGRKYLSAVMQRSAPYRSFILAETERLGAPGFLLYLPVIESGFSERAVSRSGATGIWQFMKNSVGGYGIRIDEWVDERRDPWLSSTAAIRKLMDNFNYLGDWNLALAAYNCGLGAVSRAVTRAGTKDYWELCARGYFKPETVNYVPKFLAIAEILSRSAELGISWGEALPQHEIAVLSVSKAVDLNQLAEKAGGDPDVFRQLNPALHYSITPPAQEYALRIPARDKTAVEAALASGESLLEYYVYKIRSGDTLYALARHYGVTTDMIAEYNPGIRPEALRIGSTILIPALKEVHAYRGSRGDETLRFTGTYLVKAGDTLWSIALAYDVQVETLAEKNGMEVNAVLRVGKVLKVPDRSADIQRN